MSPLTHILVALDVKGTELTASGRRAWELALGLAREHGAQLTLVHVLEVKAKLQKRILDGHDSPAKAHYQQVQDLLKKMTTEAKTQGLEADSEVLFGKAGMTLVRKVLKSNPDLLMAGAASRGAVAEALFGSTTITLLRQCPCPFWITKGDGKQPISNVLVAHCLTEMGSTALGWGVATAEAHQAPLHILHSLELEAYEGFLASMPADELDRERSSAKERIQNELAQFEFSQAAEIIVTEGSPHASIYKYLEEHSIDLLVMGTIARTGLAGVFTGNTAESLLPWVRCSLIALKPKDFVSPVTLD